MKTCIALIILAIMLGAAFLGGSYFESIRLSLQREANYPFDLQKNIDTSAFSCPDFSDENKAISKELPDRRAVMVATYVKSDDLITVTIVDANNRVASDNWHLGCNNN